MALAPQQMQILQTAIEQRRAALVAELKEDWNRVRRDQEELFGAVPDPGDESVARLIADLDKADLGRDLAELRELEAARARLAAGSYGVCIDCGREIGFERLKANPAALRCIADQTRYELTHGASAGPSL
jgi:RNA polymerase-binding transcription factor DksA